MVIRIIPEIVTESRAVDIDGSTRGRDGENAGIIEARGVCGTIPDPKGVSSPVLVTAVVTFRFSNPSTPTLEVEMLRDKPGGGKDGDGRRERGENGTTKRR